MAIDRTYRLVGSDEKGLFRSLKEAAWRIVDEFHAEDGASYEQARIDSGFGYRVNPIPVDPTPYRERLVGLLQRYGVKKQDFRDFLVMHSDIAEEHHIRYFDSEAATLLHDLAIFLDF